MIYRLIYSEARGLFLLLYTFLQYCFYTHKHSSQRAWSLGWCKGSWWVAPYLKPLTSISKVYSATETEIHLIDHPGSGWDKTDMAGPPRTSVCRPGPRGIRTAGKKLAHPPMGSGSRPIWSPCASLGQAWYSLKSWLQRSRLVALPPADCLYKSALETYLPAWPLGRTHSAPGL